MKKNYGIFKSDDLSKSIELAKKLNISQVDFNNIQNWFDLLLLEHQKADDSDKQLITEKELESKFEELNSALTGKECFKYILAKLLYYNNIFSSGYLRSLCIARILYLTNKLTEQVIKNKDYKYSGEDFLAFSEYLKNNFFVSPNGDLLKNILKVEKKHKVFLKAQPKIKLDILKNIINIIDETNYHHDIICYKKILKSISEQDENSITFLKRFQVKNNQGCYIIINDILNLELLKNQWKDFITKVELISFLDTARSAQPNLSWVNKLKTLSEIINKSQFKTIADTIQKNDKFEIKNFVFENGGHWSDDTAKRFLKSASWIEIKKPAHNKV